MSPETSQIREALLNCQVLIVEDDVPLASRIAWLFKDFTIRWPIIAHSVEQARKIVVVDQESFGLAIVDIMLPLTDEDFTEIQEHEKTLARVRKMIEEAGTHPVADDAKSSLFDARYERSQVLRRIEDLIDREGGIDLVEEWRRSNQLFPIVFLTAVGNEKTIQRGLSVAGECSDWVIKPVPSNLILEKCVNLLQKKVTSSGG